MMSYSLGNSLLVPAPSAFVGLPRDRLNENNNNQIMMDENEKIQEIWNKHTFKSEKVEQALSLNDMKVNSWINENISKSQGDVINEPEKPIEEPEHEEEPPSEPPEIPKEEQNGSPSHHARRPMNAFLIFCKKHRPIVRDRYPNLENRGVTKILGEWWSLLEEGDKTPFTNLANEYKDAFLSANPDFKWYKLPAPPLRTLLVRPANSIPKLPSPQSSPSHNSLRNFNQFTPGKLADESQLGSVASLLNNNFSPIGYKIADCCENRKDESVNTIVATGENNNELEEYDTSLQSPVNLMKTADLPPKPIKKRIFSQFTGSNTKELSRNILNTDCNEKYSYCQLEHKESSDSMTNQDIVDKVVDTLFVEKNIDIDGMDFKEHDKTRKSGRQCKGKRYEQFMVEGKLLGNKRDTRLTQNKLSDISKETPTDKQVPERKPEITTPNLENTIKRLAERTKIAITQNEPDDLLSPAPKDEKEEFCYSETSESSPSSNFNLDLKISNLPSLSYDAFVQRKRESKKRKLRKVSSENWKNEEKSAKKEETLVGSKKRKNKHSITHLEKANNKTDFNDLLGLATLAEVAANTQKINET